MSTTGVPTVAPLTQEPSASTRHTVKVSGERRSPFSSRMMSPSAPAYSMAAAGIAPLTDSTVALCPPALAALIAPPSTWTASYAEYS